MRQTIKFNKLNMFLHCLALTYGQAEKTNGIKTSVKFEGKTKYFIYEGNTLLGQYTDDGENISDRMMFIYDENGEIQGAQYSQGQNATSLYYYQKDVFGNVGIIRNMNGDSIASYQYEAYGHNFAGSSGNEYFAQINPITYRCYYHDGYFGGYYNLSRYYHPIMGRFFNLDDPMIALQSKSDPDGMNLFAYCNNDPVNFVDPDGKYRKIKWLRGYVNTSTVATLIDIVVAIVSPAVSAGYDVTGYALKKVFKNYGEKSAEKYFVNNVKPVIKYELSKFGNKICTAIIKITGRTIDAIGGSLISKALSLIPRIFDYILKINFSTLVDIVMLWTSIGGVVAFLLDYIPDLRYDGRIYRRQLFR